MDYVLNNQGLQAVDLSVKNIITSNNFDSFFETVDNRNNAGVSVTPNSAMTYSSVFEAVQIISGDVARIDLDIYEPNDEDRVKRRRHPAYRLLNRKANSYTSGYAFRETLQAHALLWGNGYAEIVHDEVGRPKELLILDPSRVTPEVIDGELIYRVYSSIDRKESKILPAYKVFHVRGLGFNGIQGFSVVTLARDSWGLGMAAERHGARHFKQGARPNVVLKHPAHLDQDQAEELVEAFQSKHSGADGVGRPALAAGGLEIVPLSMSNTDSQWLESREFQRIEVASWFALPPHKLGDSSRMAYNSIEAEERAYASQTLMRWFERWESEVDMKLLTDRQFGADWFSEHAVEKLVQGDSETQVDTVVKLRNAMVITQNEARHKLNYASVEDGDTFLNPSTYSADNANPDEEDDTEEPEEESDGVVEQVENLLAARMSQLENTYNKQIKNLEGKDDKIKNFTDTFAVKMVEAIMPILNLLSACKKEQPHEESAVHENILAWMKGEHVLLEGIV